MKVRNGFVSNSSSSSFLVGIEPECKTFDDFILKGLEGFVVDESGDISILEKVIDTEVPDCKCYNNGKSVTYRECFRRLWDDLMHSNYKADVETCKQYMEYDTPVTNIGDEFRFVSIYDAHNICNSFSDPSDRKKFEKRLAKIGTEWNLIVGEALTRRLLEEFDHNVYEITYSDNEGYALMEHGDFWKFVPHVKINQH